MELPNTQGGEQLITCLINLEEYIYKADPSELDKLSKQLMKCRLLVQ